MAEYILKVKTALVRITVSRNQETATAQGIVLVTLGEEYQVIAKTTDTFSGLCDAEIVHGLVFKMLFTNTVNGEFIDAPDLDAALDEADIPVCSCD